MSCWEERERAVSRSGISAVVAGMEEGGVDVELWGGDCCSSWAVRV